MIWFLVQHFSLCIVWNKMAVATLLLHKDFSTVIPLFLSTGHFSLTMGYWELYFRLFYKVGSSGLEKYGVHLVAVENKVNKITNFHRMLWVNVLNFVIIGTVQKMKLSIKTKSTVSYEFCHIYWWNTYWQNSFLEPWCKWDPWKMFTDHLNLCCWCRHATFTKLTQSVAIFENCF